MWERAGFRIRDSGVRMKSICFPPTAFCLLPTAYCLLPTAFEGGVRVGGTVGVRRSLRQDVTADSGRKNS
jgi:hypothetical protein